MDKENKIHKAFMVIWSLLKRIKEISDEDSLRGYIVTIILIIVIIKFIIFPVIGLILGNTNFPIVSVVSNSMEHKLNQGTICGKVANSEITDFNDWWTLCGDFYSKIGITKDVFTTFSMMNGFNIGDAMIIYKKNPEDIKVGDIALFIRQDNKPIIHRVINIRQKNNQYYFTTKGDFNPFSGFYELNISYEQLEGIAILKLPYLGLPRYWLSKLLGVV